MTVTTKRIWSLCTFSVNGVPHRYCVMCIDLDYALSVADKPGIGTQSYGDCEACGIHVPPYGPYRYIEVNG